MPDRGVFIHDSADKTPPQPSTPPHRTISGADFARPTRAHLDFPWHVSAALGVLMLILLGLLVWWLSGWAQRNPDAADAIQWGFVALLAALIFGAVVYAFTMGYFALVERYGWALRAHETRTRLGNPAPLTAVIGQGLREVQQFEIAAAAMQVAVAKAAPTPLLSTNSANSETGGDTTIYGAGEDEQTPALPPPIVTLDSFPPLDSPTAVPLGLAGAEPISLDFGKDTLHVGLYGASGAGKDNLLRAWFMALTRRNTPDQVGFAVLDGKGDWLTADLAQLAHMWMPPAGGAGQAGVAAMRAGIEQIEAEMVRRLVLVNAAGCRTREAYMQRTGASLPLLIVLVTDGVTAIDSTALTRLMNDLVSKARAVGIRVVVSMQTPTGQDMRWRLNLSTYISGHLPHPSQDLVALGLTKDELADGVRPSQLPTPQQEPGLFIVRQGALVKRFKAVLVSDEVFDGYVARLAQRVAAPDPRAAQKAAIRAMDDLARMRELRRLTLERGNTRTGWKYTTDELRDLFGMQQNKLVAIVGALRQSSATVATIDPL